MNREGWLALSYGVALAIGPFMGKSSSIERDRLILEHVEVARRISLRMARRCPRWIPREDLIAAGMLGLTEAAARYDGTRQEPFLSFAEKRIRGAVLDELRRGDMMPRRIRKLARKIGETIARIERESGATPDDATVATALGVSLDEYRTGLQQLVHVKVQAIEPGDVGPVDAGESPEDQAAQRLVMQRVEAAMTRLEARDVDLLSLHYQQDLTYGETGKKLGVTTSRVCQLHGRAIERLRVAIGTQTTEALAA
jgi:RNA polymerase sigma factor FliA